MTEWQPIETAPKDGPIWAYVIANGVASQGVIWWRPHKNSWPEEPNRNWRWRQNDNSTVGFSDGLPNPGATHWMPLLEPPKCSS
jgi:hypothetical protein